MRMSCNGCRVLRKGCSEDCSIRPCLQWIKNPESQANATVFLAKFYGRAGLMNLINAGPEHLRPAIFRSLLFEACGRIVNPIYGSVGLLWSGSWQLCQAAVEAVLRGAPVMQIASETAANAPAPPINRNCSYDIRHVSKDGDAAHLRDAAPANDIHKVNKATRRRFKRPGNCNILHANGVAAGTIDHFRMTSDESSASHSSRAGTAGEAEDGGVACADTHRSSDSRENDSMFSAETPEASTVSHAAEPGKANGRGAKDGEVQLELTLGFEPVHRSPRSSSSSSSHSLAHSPYRSSSRSTGREPPKRCDLMAPGGWSRDICSVDLELDLAA